MNKVRTDSVPTILVDVGNFATADNDAEALPRRELLTNFFKDQHYDAVTLGEQELTSPFCRGPRS